MIRSVLVDGGCKEAVGVIFEVIDLDAFMIRIDQPADLNAGRSVEREFVTAVVVSRAFGQYFDDQIGCAVASFFIKFAAVADDRKVWLHNGCDLLIIFPFGKQPDSVGGCSDDTIFPF